MEALIASAGFCVLAVSVSTYFAVQSYSSWRRNQRDADCHTMHLKESQEQHQANLANAKASSELLNAQRDAIKRHSDKESWE